MPDHNLPYLQVSAVRKSYGDSEVLRGIDLEMEQGSILALLGSSGSGKTTLLGLIGGRNRPQSGSVQVEGLDVPTLSKSKLYALLLAMNMLVNELLPLGIVVTKVSVPLRG